MKPLDATDRRLLALLQDNSRVPLVALARAIGRSRSATQQRLHRLEASGVIQKYTIRLGTPDQPRVQAWLSLGFAPGVNCATVMPALGKFPEVKLAQSVAGGSDMMALVETESVQALARLRDQIAQLPEVRSVDTTPVLATPLDRR
jgi:DNA-binding Lrp family transcriptional regulator